ncbi:MAG: 50S ribosomal protein L32 [Candidatus Pacebacteria bacterium]|nr:50S ribosomal protein L32 [Candidatus Paceibacterota bacterium]
MAVPKKRTTKSRQGKRRLHIHLEAPKLTLCPKCKKPVLPHTVCLNCGYYKGEMVIDVFKKLSKKEKKKKEKELKEAEKAPKKELSMEELSKKS